MEICRQHVAQLVMFNCKQISSFNFDLSCRREAWSAYLNTNSPFSAETRMIRSHLSLHWKRHDNAVNHNWLLSCYIHIRETRSFQSHNNNEIKPLGFVLSYRRIPESHHFRGQTSHLSLSLSSLYHLPLNNEHKKICRKKKKRKKKKGEKKRKRESASSRRSRDSTGIKKSVLNLRNSLCRTTGEGGERREVGLSGVAAATAESVGAAFWVSGSVLSPSFTPAAPLFLLIVHLLFHLLLLLSYSPTPTKFGKAAVRAAHECGTVGQRTPWPPPTAAYPSSVHAPWCDTYDQPTDPSPLRRRPHPRAPPYRPFIPALPAPYFSLLHPSRPSSVSFSACNGPVVSSRERLRYRTRCSLRDLVSPIASRMNCTERSGDVQSCA